MIALDTNVLVRYVVEDDPEQAAIARRVIEESLSPVEPGFVSLVALIEMNWVLMRAYGCSAQQVTDICAELLASPTIVVEQASAVAAALASSHDDFGDNLLHELGRAQGCVRTVTFDRKFARQAGVELLA